MDSNNLDVGHIIFKTQKKLLSSFANRKTIGPVLDDDGKKFLNSAYSLLKEMIGKTDGQKMISRWIKIIVKITFLHKNDHLNADEIKWLDGVRCQFSTIVKTVLSFWNIEFSFECEHLQQQLRQLESTLNRIVARHMTEKNKAKIKSIFSVITSDKFLTTLFNCDKSSKLAVRMNEFSEILESLANNNKL